MRVKLAAMNLASLAFVGWYLMAAPYNKAGDGLVLNAPISQWRTIANFDTAKGCDQTRKGLIEAVRNKYSSGIPADEVRDYIELRAGAESMQCIATDDPRLKGK